MALGRSNDHQPATEYATSEAMSPATDVEGEGDPLSETSRDPFSRVPK